MFCYISLSLSIYIYIYRCKYAADQADGLWQQISTTQQTEHIYIICIYIYIYREREMERDILFFIICCEGWGWSCPHRDTYPARKCIIISDRGTKHHPRKQHFLLNLRVPWRVKFLMCIIHEIKMFASPGPLIFLKFVCVSGWCVYSFLPRSWYTSMQGVSRCGGVHRGNKFRWEHSNQIHVCMYECM